MRVPAKACEQVVAGFKRVEQMEGRDGSARAVSLLRFPCNDQRRTASFFHDSRCYYPDYATVPALAIKHHAELSRQVRCGGELLFNLSHNTLLFRLTLQIKLIQLLCDVLAPALVSARE